MSGSSSFCSSRPCSSTAPKSRQICKVCKTCMPFANSIFWLLYALRFALPAPLVSVLAPHIEIFLLPRWVGKKCPAHPCWLDIISKEDWELGWLTKCWPKPFLIWVSFRNGVSKHGGENGDYRECLYIEGAERRHDTMSVLSEGSWNKQESIGLSIV